MSSNIGDRDQPPLSQKVVGAIFFILPVAFIVVFLSWCWRRQRRSAQVGHWAGLIPAVIPQCIPMESLPTAPELHSVHVQLEASGVKIHWSGIKVRTHYPICSSDLSLTLPIVMSPCMLRSGPTRYPSNQDRVQAQPLRLASLYACLRGNQSTPQNMLTYGA